MFLLHTKLPSFIKQLKSAALRHNREVPCDVLGLENLETAKIQSARTGRLEHEVEDLSLLPGAERIEVRIVPRVPETLHTVIVRALDKDGKPIHAIVDTVGILHPGIDYWLGGCPEVEDRRPPVGKH